MLSKKITKEELLIVTAARQIKDHDVCLLGIGMPILAGAWPSTPTPRLRS